MFSRPSIPLITLCLISQRPSIAISHHSYIQYPSTSWLKSQSLNLETSTYILPYLQRTSQRVYPLFHLLLIEIQPPPESRSLHLHRVTRYVQIPCALTALYGAQNQSARIIKRQHDYSVYDQHPPAAEPLSILCSDSGHSFGCLVRRSP